MHILAGRQMTTIPGSPPPDWRRSMAENWINDNDVDQAHSSRDTSTWDETYCGATYLADKLYYVR